MIDTPLDQIRIQDLLSRCIVGVYPEERTEKQDVIINITLFADLSRAGRTDQIEDTVDYKNVKKAVLAHVEQSAYFLLEKLAEEIAAICLAAPNVVRVTVSVDKPGALRFARSVAVEITRERPGGQ